MQETHANLEEPTHKIPFKLFFGQKMSNKSFTSLKNNKVTIK